MQEFFGAITVGHIFLVAPAIVELIRRIIAKEPFLNTLIGALVGFLLGGVYHLVELMRAVLPVDFPAAFDCVMYGLLTGLTIGGLISGSSAVRNQVQINRQIRFAQQSRQDDGLPK